MLNFPQVIVIFACTATPVATPPNVSDSAPGWKNLSLNLDDCKREDIQVSNVGDPNKELDFRGPEQWMRAAAQIGMAWEQKHPGWYIYRMKGPDPMTGKLPEGCPVDIKCPYEAHSI